MCIRVAPFCALIELNYLSEKEKGMTQDENHKSIGEKGRKRKCILAILSIKPAHNHKSEFTKESCLQFLSIPARSVSIDFQASRQRKHMLCHPWRRKPA
jgi:hypothetical protein